MKISKLKNKRIFLAPYNDESQVLHKFLDQNISFSFLGYLDNFKIGDKVYTIQNTKEEYDYIIILSPYYNKSIVEDLLNLGINKNRLLYSNRANKKKRCFHFYTSKWLYAISNYIFNKYHQISLLSISDYINLHNLKNIHSNKKAFIIGNGPSLSVNDLDLIKDEITFASNKIYLAFDKTEWRPTYYFVTDGLVYSQNYEKIDQLKLKKYFSSHLISLKDRMKDSTYFSLSFQHPAKFKVNPIFNLYSGSTVTFVMLEFAVFMGIKEIYLMGIDFSFILPNRTDSKELSCEGEVNHFHEDYRKVGEKWTKPDMKHQKLAFLEAKKFCDKHDIRIYNISRNSKLDVFELVDFDLFITSYHK